MLKKIGKALPVLVAAFVALLFMACPTAAEDPEYGNLKGGPQKSNDPAITPPEDLDIVVYGVRLGGQAAEKDVKPSSAFADAAIGSIFLGSEAETIDATDLKVTWKIADGEEIKKIEFGMADSSSTAPASYSEDATFSGVFPSGKYLTIKLTQEVTENEVTTDVVTYYKYLVTWGQNGVFIESITIAGRTFTSLGTPYSGDTEAGTTGLVNGTVYLTSAQIAANRPIEVKLAADSQRALITFGSSTATAAGAYPTTDAAAAEYRLVPPSAALANNSRINIRIKSLNGDTYGNYRIQVTTANQAALGTLTVATATTSGLGTPRGAWNAVDLVNGTAIAIKNTRLAGATAAHSGGTGIVLDTLTWAFVSTLDQEPEFVALGEPTDLAYNGYIYVRAVNGNYMNIYRFPVVEQPLSSDATLRGIQFGEIRLSEGDLGTPADTVAGATAANVIQVSARKITQPLVEYKNASAIPVVAYGLLIGTATTTDNFTATVPATIADGNTLVVKSTAESGAFLFYKIPVKLLYDDVNLRYINFGQSVANLGMPSATEDAGIVAGTVDLYSDWTGSSSIDVGKATTATLRYATSTTENGTHTWATTQPSAASLAANTWVWFEVSPATGSNKLFYKIKIVSRQSGQYGRGVIDSDFKANKPYFVFPNLGDYELLTDNIGSDGMPTKMPNVQYWSGVNTPAGEGHLHEFVDPFHFANGNRVATIADWENRRKEIRMIVGYYHKGFVPSLDPSVVDIWLSGTNNTTINVRHKASGRTYNVTMTPTANASATVAGREGKLGLGTAVAASNNWAMALTVSEITSAQLTTLYGITGSQMETRDSRGAWSRSILLIAIEGTKDPVTAGGAQQTTEQYYYPVPVGTHLYNDDGNGSWFTTKGPLATTGTSTGGKQAMHQIVLAHGRKTGTRAGFTNIGDSGSSGHMTQKMLYQAGLRLDVSAQEALRLSGFSEAYITQVTSGLPNNSADLPDRQGQARTIFGPSRTAGFYNVNPDGKLKMGQYSVRGQTLAVRGSQPYGWAVALAPDNAVGFSKRETTGSNGGMEDTWGAPWYHVGIRGEGQTTNMKYSMADAVLNPSDRGTEVAVVRTMFNGPETGMPAYKDAAGSNQVVRRERLARGWSPYFDAFNAAPQSSSNTGMEFPLPNGENYIEVPYTAWYSMIDGQSNPGWVAGFGTWIDDPSTGTWNNSIMASFPVNHSILGFDYRDDDGGWQCSIPSESYYQAMLDAPYGVQVHAYPTMQNRTNDYGSFTTWLVVDEIYKMYGEAEGNGTPAAGMPANSGLYDGWDKYLYNNMQDYWWGNHAGMQGAATPSMTAARTRHLENGVGVATTVAFAKNDITIARFRDPNYLVDDPNAWIVDWHKMHISRPKPDGTPGTPISERVGRRVTPILADFFKGEIFHNAPARYGPTVSARTYHDAAKEQLLPGGRLAVGGNLALSGTKFKPMDWRGLLDNPENQ